IGSITKTFTAILVLRLRDEGRLALGDPLERFVPGTPFGGRTVGQLLAHAGGVQSETAGPWWGRGAGGEWGGSGEAPPRGALDEDGLVDAPGRSFHYSNLGYGALGELVARLRGRPWVDCLQAEILDPLELRRTSYGPQAPHARGFAVHPFAQAVLEEPTHDG